jgi:hypothetical protein
VPPLELRRRELAHALRQRGELARVVGVRREVGALARVGSRVEEAAL